MPNEKRTGRFIILVLMACTILAVSVWALLQSLSYINKADAQNIKITSNNQPDNIYKDSSEDETFSVDMDKLGEDILSNVKFETKLKQIDENVARSLIAVSDSAKLKLYMGSGNYADELILITSASADEATFDQQILEQYLSDAKKSFDAYIPEQAKKISDAVIQKSGRYTIACVTSDTYNAVEVIQSAFGEDNTEPVTTPAAEIESSKSTASPVKYREIYSNANVVLYPSGIIVVGDTAYEQYNYIESIATQYANVVNSIAVKFGEKADIYNIIIPTSVGITFPDNKKGESASSDQKDALQKITSKISDDVNIVPLYDELISQRKEYIYFRTDHHWTAKGAYYAYASFCKSKQITPNNLKDYNKTFFGDFAGSFYIGTGRLPSLKKDKFYVYYPVNSEDLTLKYTNKNGVVINGNVIGDASSIGETLKYSAFIEGDNPFTSIENNKLTDGSSCIVIKDSFGNSLIPYLADHYQKIYAIDYRYWSGNLTEFIKENPVDDIIIANNISVTRNSYQVGKMALLAEGTNGI